MSTCPDCGSSLVLDQHAAKGVLVFRPNPGGMPSLDETRRPAIVAFCNGCEFCVEVATGGIVRESYAFDKHMLVTDHIHSARHDAVNNSRDLTMKTTKTTTKRNAKANARAQKDIASAAAYAKKHNLDVVPTSKKTTTAVTVQPNLTVVKRALAEAPAAAAAASAAATTTKAAKPGKPVRLRPNMSAAPAKPGKPVAKGMTAGKCERCGRENQRPDGTTSFTCRDRKACDRRKKPAA